MDKNRKLSLAGAAAGAVNGFFGAGGGMVLVPLLEKTGEIPEEKLFPSSLLIMCFLCLTSLLLSGSKLPLQEALPYLIGSFLGGVLARKVRLPAVWLHRILGALILFGGGRLLWN